MRKDRGINGDAQRIEQLVWMIFLKVIDDRESEQELLDTNYKSPLPDYLRWRNWAADPEGMTGDELLDFVDNKRKHAIYDTLQPSRGHFLASKNSMTTQGNRRDFFVAF